MPAMVDTSRVRRRKDFREREPDAEAACPEQHFGRLSSNKPRATPIEKHSGRCF